MKIFSFYRVIDIWVFSLECSKINHGELRRKNQEYHNKTTTFMLSKHCERKARKHFFFLASCLLHNGSPSSCCSSSIPLLWRLWQRRKISIVLGVKSWKKKKRSTHLVTTGERHAMDVSRGWEITARLSIFFLLLSYLRLFNIVPLTKWSKWQWHSTIGIVWPEKKLGKTNWIWVGWDGSRLNASSIPAVRRLWWPLWYAPLSFRVRTQYKQGRFWFRCGYS